MELDRTRIAIRERGLLETLDLALHVLRSYGGPLLLATLAGVAPFALFNGIVLHRIIAHEMAADSIARYLFLMSLLVFIQAPVASLPATRYLGWTMFYEPARAKATVRELWRLSPRLLWCQGLLRGVIPAMVLAVLLDPYQFTGIDGFLILIAVIVIPFRAFRPYINEIVLLERNPLRTKNSQTLTIGRRSSALHSPSAGDLLVRWICAACLAVLLTSSLALATQYLVGTFGFNFTWGRLMIEGIVPLTMWTVACFLATFRFLSYLDLRIRREGWEVELSVRAAAVQLKKHLA